MPEFAAYMAVLFGPIIIGITLFITKETTMEQPSTLPAVLANITRHAAQLAAGALVSKGVITDGQTETVTGVLIGIAALAWGIFQKVSARKALKDAIAAPAGSAKPF